MRNLVLAVMLIVFPLAAPAQQQSWVWSGGTCGEAMQNIEQNARVWEALYLRYVLGYVSGYNSATTSLTKKSTLIGEGISEDTVVAMFKNKCRQDALKEVVLVADEIYREMRERKR